MRPDSIIRPAFRGIIGVLVLSVAASLLGADGARESTALSLVPADAAFFASMLRNREQWNNLAGSRVLAKLGSLKTVRVLHREFLKGFHQARETAPNAEEFTEGLQTFLTWYSQPENRELVALVRDMVSDEMFFFGDRRWTDMSRLYQQVNEQYRKDISAGGTLQDAQEKMVADLLTKLELPTVVIGFRLRDPKLAGPQLGRLKEVIEQALEGYAELKSRLKSVKLGGGEFLTWELDGKLIPWDELPAGADADLIDKLREPLEKKTFVVTLGVRGPYLLAYFGASNAGLENLGKGELLFDRPELARLREHASEPFVSLSYVSQEYAEVALDVGAQFEDSLKGAAAALNSDETAAFIPEEIRERAGKDLAELGADVRSLLDKPGAQVAFSYLTPKGYSCVSQNWGENKAVDASQRLTILDHVGGSPLFVSASRERYRPEVYQTTIKWAQRLFGYVDDFVPTFLDDETKDLYIEVRDAAIPLLQRANFATTENLLPALRDGQSACVIDSRLASKRWHAELPESRKPLPIFEFAAVIGVSDSEKLVKAIREYYDLLNTGWDMLHRRFPDQFDAFSIPEPIVEKTDAATYYVYRLPDEAGLDDHLAPQASLGKNLLTLTLSRDHAKRLMTPTPLRLEGPAGKNNGPLAAVSYVNFAGLIDVVDAWGEFLGREMGTAIAPAVPKPEEGEPEMSSEEFLTDIRTILQSLKCVRGVSSSTALENGAFVTHTEWYIQDIPLE